MRYVAAYLLAALGGNKNPSADDIETILSSVGIDVDQERLGVVISELSGKNVNELVEQGKLKLASVPVGGGGGGGGGGGAAAAGAAPAAVEKAPEVKEEKKEESEESEDDMGFGLFD